jgi:hypothetical protein
MFLEKSVASISNAVDRAVYVDSVFIFCAKCVIEDAKLYVDAFLVELMMRMASFRLDLLEMVSSLRGVENCME